MYPIPLDFGALTRGEKITPEDKGTSIVQYLKLLLSTRPGGYDFEPTFGIKEMYIVESEENGRMKALEEEIKVAISKFESRLNDVTVNVTTLAVQPVETTMRWQIVIAGTMANNQHATFKETFELILKDQ